MNGSNLPTDIPNFITALTPMGLRRSMLINNARMGAFIKYYDIAQTNLNNKLVWIAWFNEPLSNDRAIKELGGIGDGITRIDTR